MPDSLGNERTVVRGLCELTLQTPDPEGNVVDAWDFFENGEGAGGGVEALR